MTTAPPASLTRPVDHPSPLRVALRTLLGAALFFAGVTHLSSAREEFRAQVPAWVPLPEDFVVLASGVVEIALGLALVALLVPRLARYRVVLGLVVALFFIAIFPGNIAQWAEQKDGFGLDTDAARFRRLFFQPVLVAWALWSAGAWRPLVDRLRRR